MAAMDQDRYKVLQFFIAKDGVWRPRAITSEPGGNSEVDVVFPVLHGTFGEDGTVQGLLELADLPYVGAGVLAWAAAMDKEVFKRLCRERGLPVAESVCLRGSGAADDVLREASLPAFVKPANLGSSVGISKAKTREALDEALKLAFQYDRKVIAERAIEGRELECSVLGNEEPIASLPCEVLPSREFYDYEDKYLLDRACVDNPAKLAEDKTEELRRLAVECYRATECEGMARVDFLLENATGKLFINEINTIPGSRRSACTPRCGSTPAPRTRS